MCQNTHQNCPWSVILFLMGIFRKKTNNTFSTCIQRWNLRVARTRISPIGWRQFVPNKVIKSTSRRKWNTWQKSTEDPQISSAFLHAVFYHTKKYAVWPYPKPVFAPALGHLVNGVPSLLPERIVQLWKWQKSWQNLDGSYYKSVGSIRATSQILLRTDVPKCHGFHYKGNHDVNVNNLLYALLTLSTGQFYIGG